MSPQAISALHDADLIAEEPALVAREAAARAAVAAIPVSPVTSGFLGLSAAASPEGAALFGRVLVAPILAPHAHTPHCEPACDVRFAPHTHSAACNHRPAPVGAVWGTTVAREAADALEAALAAGGSTEELAPVRLGRS